MLNILIEQSGFLKKKSQEQNKKLNKGTTWNPA